MHLHYKSTKLNEKKIDFGVVELFEQTSTMSSGIFKLPLWYTKFFGKIKEIFQFGYKSHIIVVLLCN